MFLTKKTILITGGATGIGFALAKALEAQNNKVIIIGRRLEKLIEAQNKLSQLLIFEADLTDPESIEALFQRFKQGRIVLDVVFNNAGVLEWWDITQTQIPTSGIFASINTNLAGPIAITQLFIRQADLNKDNYIVNITTEAAIMPVPVLPLYSASKAGLSVFTQVLRIQLVNTRFKVIEIIPPSVETQMTTGDMRNTGKLVHPDIFAINVVRKIESGALEYAPGTNAKLLYIIRRFFPASGLRLIDKLSRRQLLPK